MTPEQLLRPDILKLSAYHVADAKGLVKLDAMENPHDWPGELQEAWLSHLHLSHINRYPDPSARSLKRSLNHLLGNHEEQGMILGNGSDELIQTLCLALADPSNSKPRTLLSVEPGFAMYPIISRMTGLNYVGIPLQKDFNLDIQVLLDAIDTHQPVLTFIAQPNNPTGNVFPRRQIEQIIRTSSGLVVIDEAYFPFTDSTMLDQLYHHDNLLILRTVSKMGLAGLRLGMLLGPDPWLEQLEKLRLPYNIGTLTQLTAEFALQHKETLQASVADIRRQRGHLYQQMKTLSGFTIYPSEANFLLFRSPEGTGPDLHRYLIQQGILIKNLHGSHPMLTDCLRVTVGTKEENQRFVSTLQQWIDLDP